MLLTLDLSTFVGWTIGLPDDRLFKFGQFELPKTGQEIGRFARAYNRWLLEKIDADAVSMVVFEAPILSRKTSLATARKLYGLCWHTEFVCACRGIRCLEAQMQSVRKFFAGRGNAKKVDTVEAAKLFGYNVSNDDEADAIAVRMFTLHHQFPEAAKLFALDLGLLGAPHADRKDVARGCQNSDA